MFAGGCNIFIQTIMSDIYNYGVSRGRDRFHSPKPRPKADVPVRDGAKLGAKRAAWILCFCALGVMLIACLAFAVVSNSSIMGRNAVHSPTGKAR